VGALASSKVGGEETEGVSSPGRAIGGASGPLDFGLLFLFGLWYLGNYFVSHNIA